MYLIDTCVVSEARRHSPQAMGWLASVRNEALFISAITVGEIMKGIALKMRTDPRTATGLLRWLDELRSVHASRILPVDDAVATEWGRLMARRSRPAVDTLIAATAVVHNKRIVTRNVADFADLGVEVIDPWAL